MTIGIENERDENVATTAATSTVWAVLPAYNEVEELPEAVRALGCQTRPPDHIVLAINNARPGLLDVAYNLAKTNPKVRVLDLGKCPGLKAEALNIALARIEVEPDHFVLVQDADSELAPTWIEVALNHAASDTVVGGVFLGREGGGALGMAQRNEFHSYARELYARRDRAWVLTGTGTMFQWRQARRILAARGWVYDEQVATEDFELTVAFRRLGMKTISPRGCEVLTEVMPTLKTLNDQRARWYRGAFETLRLHGLNRVTLPYFWQQTKILLGLLLGWTAIILLTTFAILGVLTVSAWWLIAVVPAVSRIVTGRHHLFSATVLPELVYDLFLQKALVTGWLQAIRNKGRVWNATEGK